jgi:hypothetical protein
MSDIEVPSTTPAPVGEAIADEEDDLFVTG